MLDCNPNPNPPAAVVAKIVEEEHACRALFITGPAGSGKSRYARAIVDVLSARGIEAEVFDDARPTARTPEQWLSLFDVDAPRAARYSNQYGPHPVAIIETRLGADEFCDRAARGDAEAAALLRRRLRVYETPQRSDSPIE